MAAATPWSMADEIQERYRHITGTPVEHDVRPYLAVVERLDAAAVEALPDVDLRTAAARLRERGASVPFDDLLAETFALTRELSRRELGLRPYDVQMAAGVALAHGRLVQLATGEGKTLAAVAPAILHAVAGRSVHVFTANDYLAKRDAAWMGPVYRAFGLQCAAIVEGTSQADRRRAYAADVTYVTAREAGFDYLRDRTVHNAAELVQRAPDVAIVDEADCILIDEARVPLVIAGPAPSPDFAPAALARVVQQLRSGIDFSADEYARTIVLTEAGFSRASALLGVQLDDPRQHLLLSAVHVALHARVLLKRDRDYVVRDGRVELVDEWTGRVADNRRWPNGIQPAVEAKEGVAIREEGRILGSIPMQHFVRLYRHLSGMTATAEPAADEFAAFFGLRTVVFPPHRPCHRMDEPDKVFTTRAAKHAAVLNEIARVHASGRPILVGTTSVSESEELGRALESRGIACRVLNARQDAQEAGIVAEAGRLGAVTISTNMAGRGTDILLGGADGSGHDAVAAAGGLYVIGTNRHESVRIDDQLRGRAGRQGDPGSSRFFISLQDDLIQRYGVMSLIPPKHRPASGAITVDDPVVAREIARAQRIVEGQNFDIRRTLWKYSALVEEQRRILDDWRQSLLDPEFDPGICEQECADRYAEVSERAGPDAVRRAEAAIVRDALDNRWSDHLAAIEDIREGIHLQRYGGREPLTEFHRQIVQAFEELMAGIRSDAVERFSALRVVNGAIDETSLGLAGSSATWTYLVNDNPFSTLGMSLLASRTLTSATGVIAVMYWPLTVIAAVSVLVRRWLHRERQRPM